MRGRKPWAQRKGRRELYKEYVRRERNREKDFSNINSFCGS
jgi:hypothetical protein